MAVKRINEISPGMVLAANALDMSGRMLLGAGSEITPKHLKIFKTWGVTEVDVKETGKASDGGEAQSDGGSDDVMKRAEAHFCQNKLGNPLIKELFAHCVKLMKKQSPKDSAADKKPRRRPLPKSSMGSPGRGMRNGRR
jgi:hypothetical protein